MPRANIYFAHPFITRGSIEEKEILEELELRRLMVYEPFKKEEEILKSYNVDDYYTRPYWELARRIWTQDLGRIKKSDIMLAWLPEKSIGTAMEIAVAYEYDKFIQIISPIKHPSYAIYADQLFESITDWKNYKVYKWENYKK